MSALRAMLSEDRRRELHDDTPLLYAARVGDVKSLKKLLADGAKIDEPKGNHGHARTSVSNKRKHTR